MRCADLPVFLVVLFSQACSAAGLESIAALAEAEIRAGRVPGAVILVGSREQVLYRRAFGQRVLGAHPEPMSVDTVFDLASLTKVVATTTAVMQLVEQRKLRLDEPVASYWPQFGANGKDHITVRELLTHYSGLRAGLDLSREWSGYDSAMQLVALDKAVARDGARFLYSDVNFLILGELVRRASGMPLDAYCREHVFAPLQMRSTGFMPLAAARERIAPTQDLPGRVHWGEVHDATARRMGGVAGHAGVFSNADDLARFARMLLNGGIENGVRILGEHSVRAMTTPQSPAQGSRTRGFGWDLGDAEAGGLFSHGAYGHLGFTGTMLWIEPRAGVYAVVLTHRVYPHGKGDAAPLRRGVVEIVSQALTASSSIRGVAADTPRRAP